MADSYATMEEAEAYFATRLGCDAWEDSSSDDKQRSLYAATRAIDGLRYSGVRSDYYNHTVLRQPFVAQPLEFPRNGSAAVPEGIKEACCECALAFLDGIEMEQELRRLSVQSQGFAAVRKSYHSHVAPSPWTLAGIPTFAAWRLLLPFLSDPREITRIRTS